MRSPAFRSISTGRSFSSRCGQLCRRFPQASVVHTRKSHASLDSRARRGPLRRRARRTRWPSWCRVIASCDPTERPPDTNGGRTGSVGFSMTRRGSSDAPRPRPRASTQRAQRNRERRRETTLSWTASRRIDRSSFRSFCGAPRSSSFRPVCVSVLCTFLRLLLCSCLRHSLCSSPRPPRRAVAPSQ